MNWNQIDLSGKYPDWCSKRDLNSALWYECINLKTNTIKILVIHFYYNRRLENDESYRICMIKMEILLKLWRMQQLTIEGKILIFKTFAIKIFVHLAIMKDVPSSANAKLEKNIKPIYLEKRKS